MHFEKVTREQWTKDILDLYNFENPSKEYLATINQMYDNIKLPQRATKHSAGYDFFISGDAIVHMEHSAVICTGIRWVCDNEEDNNKVLQIYPRSGHGFKTGIRLMNTVGIIDADYWMAENEGHIMLKFYNPLNLHTNPSAHIQFKDGEAIAQGIIMQYCTIDDEETITTERTGGFGSTDDVQ